jgi:hypothetical protein
MIEPISKTIRFARTGTSIKVNKKSGRNANKKPADTNSIFFPPLCTRQMYFTLHYTPFASFFQEQTDVFSTLPNIKLFPFIRTQNQQQNKQGVFADLSTFP